jgi:hypothetical protein
MSIARIARMRLMWPAALLCLVPLALTACDSAGGAGDKGDEGDVPLDGKFDSFFKPTDHGPIAFATPATAEITDEARYHTWTFALSGDARVDLTTSYALRGQRRTDTVLYLYEQTASGTWGPYIARNDDYADTTYSQLIKNLGVGHYRALVKGYATTTHGKFKLTVGCAGAGCAPLAPPAACLFGDTYGDALADTATFELGQTNVITAADLPGMSAEALDWVVRAVRESAWNDVTTPEEAISHVDQGMINMTALYDRSGRRSFMALEFGAGDSSYGAIFDMQSDELATAIHDGDLYRCAVTAQTCLLPADDLALRNGSDSHFTASAAAITVTDAGQVSGAQAAQVLDALHQLAPAITTIDGGLTMVDDGTISLRSYRYLPTATDLTVVSYSAGDTEIGRVYFGATTTRAATISDLEFVGCRLFAAP